MFAGRRKKWQLFKIYGQDIKLEIFSFVDVNFVEEMQPVLEKFEKLIFVNEIFYSNVIYRIR